MLAAQQFGAMQGKAAQEWVEKAVKLGDAKADNLMEMQLQLFEECKLERRGRRQMQGAVGGGRRPHKRRGGEENHSGG